MRDVTLLVLAATLAGISIYSAYEPESALGLVDRAVYAQTPVFITRVQTAVLEEEQVLQLDVPRASLVSGGQVAGTWFDPSNPPAVEEVEAYNTRIGGEVLLTWEKPAGVDAVTVQRTIAGGEKDELLLEEVVEETFLDTELPDGSEVTYEFFPVVYFEGKTYTTKQGVFAKTYVLDTIPPAAPTEVSVTNRESDSAFTIEQGLLVTWVNSTDTDVAEVHLYRSTQWGDRGELIEELEPTITEYTDKKTEAHETYYYTVVAVDKSGNESTQNFDLPPVGNAKPFEPFDTPAEDAS